MSGSDSSSIREIVVFPAPDGEERTIRSPRRRRPGGSLPGSMAALASGEPWPSSDGMVRRTKTALKCCDATYIVQCSKFEKEGCSSGRRSEDRGRSCCRGSGEGYRG